MNTHKYTPNFYEYDANFRTRYDLQIHINYNSYIFLYNIKFKQA